MSRFSYTDKDLKLLLKTLETKKLLKYDENQPRDERGRFSSTAGESDTGVEGLRDLAGGVSEHARLHLAVNKEELQRRGIVPINAQEQDALIYATKYMVATNIAERMKDEPIESIVAALPEIGYVGKYEGPNTPRDTVTAEQIMDTLNDPNKGIMYDGDTLRIISDRTLDQAPNDGTRYYDREDKEQVLREFIASEMVSSWAGSSNDSRETSLAMQERAAELFGLEDYADWEIDDATEQRVDNLTGEHGLIIDSFLQAQYDATQEYLALSGIQEISLTRGTTLTSSWTDATATLGENQNVVMRPLSSWSTSFGVSSGFGTHTLVATFPAERIFSLPITGLGCLPEQEVVVLGGTIKADVEDTSYERLVLG